MRILGRQGHSELQSKNKISSLELLKVIKESAETLTMDEITKITKNSVTLVNPLGRVKYILVQRIQ